MQRKTLRAAALGTVLLAAAAAWTIYRGASGHSAQQSVVAAAANVEPAAPQRRIKFYRNPMGLPDTSPAPKLDSMGMDYIPVYEDEQSDDGSVAVSPGKIQRAGVETAPAGRHAVTRTIKVPGVVQLDERRVTVVAPRFDGFAEHVAAVTTAAHVKRGDPLVTVYSQDVLNQGAKLVVEKGSGRKLNDDSDASGEQDAAQNAFGARRRLLNMGVPEDVVDKISRERKVPNTFTIPAPTDGVILERNVVDGQAIKSGDIIFRIADHTVIWVMADVAESDIDALKSGQQVSVTTRAHPGRVFNGKLSAIYPHLMKETRTVRVRIELPNPDLALLPDMYADVEIATGTGEEAVAVPSSAVIDSGSRQVVFIELGEGRFEPRDVKLGRNGDGFVEILSGLTVGERVVVNGTFLIDAESNLQSALKSFTPPAPATPTQASQPQEMKP